MSCSGSFTFPLVCRRRTRKKKRILLKNKTSGFFKYTVAKLASPDLWIMRKMEAHRYPGDEWTNLRASCCFVRPIKITRINNASEPHSGPSSRMSRFFSNAPVRHLIECRKRHACKFSREHSLPSTNWISFYAFQLERVGWEDYFCKVKKTGVSFLCASEKNWIK